jgi:hypothetical protein
MNGYDAFTIISVTIIICMTVDGLCRAYFKIKTKQGKG